MNKVSKNGLDWILIIGVVVYFFIFKNHDSSLSRDNYTSSDDDNALSRDEVINEHWDEIKEYVDGSETVEACSSSSGNCYDLDADISSGEIEQIHFLHGGDLSFSADIDKHGNASDLDENSDSWDFTLDMNSSIVDDAVAKWANENDYTVE